MREIVICGPGGSGTSLLSRNFNAAGMWWGNEDTHWDPRWDHHGEHEILTNWLLSMTEDHLPYGDQWKLLWKLKLGANDDRLPGVKVTQCEYPWKAELFNLAATEAYWNPQYFFCMRHPYSHGKRNGDWDLRLHYLDYYEDRMNHGWYGVPYPETWTGGHIQKVLEIAGLNQDAELESFDNSGGEGNMSEEELDNFKKDKPEIQSRWEDLKTRAFERIEA
jgi:hypothetical protein